MLTRDPETDIAGPYCEPTHDIPDLLPGLAADMRPMLAETYKVPVALISEEMVQAAYAASVNLITQHAERQRQVEPYPDTTIEEVLLSVGDQPEPVVQRSLHRALRSMWMILTPQQRARWMNLVATEDEPALYSMGRDAARTRLVNALLNYERFAVSERRAAADASGVDDFHKKVLKTTAVMKTAAIHTLMRAALDHGATRSGIHGDAAAALAEIGWTATGHWSEETRTAVYTLTKGATSFTVDSRTHSPEELASFLTTRSNISRPYGKPD